MPVAVNMTESGAQPTPPATLRANLLNLVSASRPGYTANLPGSLIEDIASTDVGALALIDQAVIDLVNSLSPSTANDYLANLLGAQYGLVQGLQSNSSAYVFFKGIAGYVINRGFIVSDGSNQYTVQTGGVLSNAVATTFTASISTTTLTVTAMTTGEIMVGDAITGAGVTPGTIVTAFGTGTGGTGDYTVNNSQTVGSVAMTGMTHGTATLYVVANSFGDWAIPANSITTIITSVPSGYPLTATNPTGGTVASEAETIELYRARTAQSMLAPAVGTLSMLKALIQAVPGVQARLVSVSGGNKIMVGGGDSYEVAGAIYRALFDVADLKGSTVLSNSWAATGSITGAVLTITAVASGAIAVNDIVSGVNVASPTVILSQLGGTPGGIGTYSINYSQTVLSESMTGANSLRNQMVTIVDYPDTYWILYVVPVSQAVEIACDWSTIAPNFTANLSISDAVTNAWVAYVNSIPVGAALNTYKLQQLFLDSITAIVEPSLISALTITVKINTVVTAPSPGTSLIPGDSEGYFSTTSTGITLTRV